MKSNLIFNSLLSIEHYSLFDSMLPVYIQNQQRNNMNPISDTPWFITNHDTGNKIITFDQPLPIDITNFGDTWTTRWSVHTTIDNYVKISSVDFINKQITYDFIKGTLSVGQRARFLNPFRSFYLDPSTAVVDTNLWATTYVSPGGVWKHSDNTYRMIINGWDGVCGMSGLYTSSDLKTWSEIYKGLISSWTNDPDPYDYDTFEATGTEITKATLFGATTGQIRSDSFIVKNGKTIKATFSLTNVEGGGQLPSLYLINAGWTLSDSEVCIAGSNDINLTSTWDGTAWLVFLNNNICNWTTTNVSVVRSDFGNYIAGIHPFDETWCINSVTHWTAGSPIKIPTTNNYAKPFQGINVAGRGEVGIVIHDEDYNIVTMPTTGITVPGYVLDSEHHYVPGGLVIYHNRYFMTIEYRNTTTSEYTILLLELDHPTTYNVINVEVVVPTRIPNSFCQLTVINTCPLVFDDKLYIFVGGENNTLTDSPLLNNHEGGVWYKQGSLWVANKENPIFINPIQMYDIYPGTTWAYDHLGSSWSFYSNESILNCFISMNAGPNTYKVGRTIMNII